MKTIVREAQPSDAEQLIGFVQRLTEEPGVNIVLAPGEFALTVEEERKFVADCAVSDNSLFLVAERIERIIGVLACAGVGEGARDGLKRGSITCDPGNAGSARTIQKNGGKLLSESAAKNGRLASRYWIGLRPQAAANNVRKRIVK